MIGETPTPTAVTPRRRPWRLLAVVLVAFALGLAAMFWAMPAIQRWRTPAPAPSGQPIVVNPNAVTPPPAVAAAPITVEGLAAREAALDLQLRAIEARMTAAQINARNAAGYAGRAERLMIAFAARRRIDRGQPLESYEALLRAHYGEDARPAVETVIAAARAPTTLEDLRASLDTIAPKLTTGTMADGVGTAIWRELTSLVILRRDTQPSPRATDRLARARRLLDAGQVEAALAEVARMPGAATAQSWMDAAKRYIEARRALDGLESVAMAPAAQPPAPPNPAGQLPGAP